MNVEQNVRITAALFPHSKFDKDTCEKESALRKIFSIYIYSSANFATFSHFLKFLFFALKKQSPVAKRPF